MKELTKPFLDRDEEARLTQLALAGDIEARNQVVMNIYPWIVKKATKYSQRVPHDDLVNHAVIMCLEKFGLFDPARGIRTMTYLCTVAERQMQRLTKIDGVIKAPTNISDLNLDETQQKAEAARRGPMSLNSLLPKPNSESGDSTMGDFLVTKEPSPDEKALKKDEMEVFAGYLRWLPERWQLILRLRILEKQTLKQVGARMGITRERVRQIQAKAHDYLRRMIKSGRPIKPVVPLVDRVMPKREDAA